MRAERLRAIASTVACAAALTIASATPAGARNAVDLVGARIVHREKSVYRNVMVTENRFHRCMIFTRRIRLLQTCVDRAAPGKLVLPYSHGMMTALIAQPKAKRALIVGLGGGVITRAVRDVSPQIDVDTIELDPAVVDVAKRYFGFRENAHVKTYVNDGRVFIRQQLRKRQRYDIVMIDACDNDFVPEHLLTREFMGEIRTLLNPGGVVVANSFSKGRLVYHESATYRSVFRNVLEVDVEGGNRILLAGRDGDLDVARLKRNLPAAAPKFERIGVSAPDLVSIARPSADPKGARPLTDKYSPANLLFGE